MVVRGGLDFRVNLEINDAEAELERFKRKVRELRRDLRAVQTTSARLRRNLPAGRGSRTPAGGGGAGAGGRQIIDQFRQLRRGVAGVRARQGVTNNHLRKICDKQESTNRRLGVIARRLRQQQTRQRADRRPAAVPAPPGPTTGRRGRGIFSELGRLARVVLVLEGLRRTLDAVSLSFRAVIANSARIEQATLGVASVLTSVGDIFDDAGNEITGGNRLNVALSVAREQVEQLRIEGLRTAATFEELANAFQIAVGPGLQAGLNIDEIREFTVGVAQAAAAIGVTQRELSEEVRSLLTGRIRLGQSRIAGVLGVTPEDIRRAREAGNLAEFLKERFQEFGVAAERAMDTLIVRATNLQDALLQVGSEGATDFFQDLKDAAADLTDALVEIDGNRLVLNPEAVAVARSVANSLQVILNVLRQIGNAVGFEGLQAVAEIFEALIEAAAPAAVFVISTLVDSLIAAGRIIASVVGGIRNIISSVTGATDGMSQFTQTVLEVVGPIIAIRLALAGVRTVLRAIVILSSKWLLIPLLLVGALNLVLRNLEDILEPINNLISRVNEFTGLDIGQIDVGAAQDGADAVADGIIDTLRNLSDEAADLFEEVFGGFGEAFGNTGTGGEDLEGFLSGVRDIIAATDVDADQLALSLASIQQEIRTLQTTGGRSDLFGGALSSVNQELQNIERTLIPLTNTLDEFDRREGELRATPRTSDNNAAIEAELLRLSNQRQVAEAEIARVRNQLGPQVLAIAERELLVARQLGEQQLRTSTAAADFAQQRLDAEQRLTGSRLAEAERLIAIEERRFELESQFQDDRDALRTRQRELTLLQQQVNLFAERAGLTNTLNGLFSRAQAQLDQQLLRTSELVEAERERLRLAEERERRLQTFGGGFQQGFIDNQRTPGEQGAALGAEIANSFRQFGRDFAAIFDPTQNGSLRNALGNLALAISEALINAAIQAAIIEPIIGNFAAAPPSGAKGGFVAGFDEGGKVPKAGRLNSSPDGIDHRDRVPALLRPGEFVNTPPLVKALARIGLGPGLLDAYNKGRRGVSALRDGVLHALGGLPDFRAPQLRGRQPRLGMASGGLVGGDQSPTLLEQLASSASAPAAANGAAVSMPRQVLVVDDQVRRQMVTQDSLVEIIGSNPAAFRAALRV